MSIEPNGIRNSLLAIADLIAIGDGDAAHAAILDLARQVGELTSKERIELLAGRELIVRMRDQLSAAKGTIEDLRARIGCHD